MNKEYHNFLIKNFAESQLNRLPEKYDKDRIFSDPLIGVAKGNDPIFQKFKEVVGKEHYLPIEFWNQSGLPSANSEDLRIVSIVFPYTKRIRDEGKNEKNYREIKRYLLPAEIYCIGRNYANAFKKDILRKSIKYVEQHGFKATAPMLSDIFTLLLKGEFYSNWSERHVAFASGLGTFSLHDGLITELGCNVRFASFITNAPFQVTLRSYTNPYEYCLFHAEGTCGVCIEKCPGKAISEEGHDKNKCFKYENNVGRKVNDIVELDLKPHKRRINWKLRDQRPPVGCAFCQFGVPCMDKNPTKPKDK